MLLKINYQTKINKTVIQKFKSIFNLKIGFNKQNYFLLYNLNNKQSNNNKHLLRLKFFKINQYKFPQDIKIA